MGIGIDSMVKKIDELRTETCCLYVAYVPSNFPVDQYESLRAQLSHGADAGANFVIVPESIKIDVISKIGDIKVTYT